MKRLISILIIFILTLGFIPVDKAYGETIDYYIDVKLTRPLVQNDYVNLTSTNGFIIYDKEDKENPLFSIEDTSIKAMPNNGHIDLMDSANNILYSLPSDGSLIIGPNNLEEPIITVEKDSYRGYIRLFINDGELIVINHVYLEDYLYGVVPREMSYTSPMEALKAQAVASRSFAMHNINKHAQEGFNLCDTTHCQAYAGYIYERSSTNQAVDETMGVLIYYEGEVIEAIYHSTSSGYTEDSSNVWGGSIPYLKSVEDHFSLDSPHNNWSFSIKLSDLNEKIIGAGINIGELQNIEIIETTSTNKVKNVKLIGSLGEEIITGERFRNIIGTTTLKSAWFRIKDSTSNTVNYAYVLDGNSLEPKVIDISKAQIIDGNNRRTVTRSAVVRATGNDRIRNFQQSSLISGEELVIEGSGYGHGVGMSQYGAKKMAEYGYTFEEILKYYYTGVDVF